MTHDDEQASILPDEEDEDAEQTAEGGMASLATSEGDGTQALQISNSDEVIDEGTANTQGGIDNDNDDKTPTGPRDSSVSHDPAVLAARRITESTADHVSIRVVQQIARVHLLTFSGLIGQNELSKISPQP